MSNEQKSTNVVVIELINQQPSNFYIDGAASEDSDLPSNISAPNAWKIRNKCKIKYIETKGDNVGMEKLKTIRYIKGCDEIDAKLQDEMGIKPNPAHDTIWILNGKLTAVEAGSDIGLYRFIKAHENNQSNPNAPDGAVAMFKELDTNVEAMQLESIFDEERKILNYLDTLKFKSGDSYQYNTDALTFLCSLFKLPAFSSASPSEAWVNIAIFAKENPRKFLNSLASQKALIEADVNQALSKGVIMLDDTQAMFMDSKKVITGFNSNATTDEKVAMLVDFMSNPKHRNYYDNLRSDLHQKNVGAASVVQ